MEDSTVEVFPPDPAGNTHLRQETKIGWSSGKTTSAGYYIHGTPVAPATVKTQGLTPQAAREWLVEPRGVSGFRQISGGRMLFSFYVNPTNLRKSAGVNRLWGYDSNCFVFLVPVGTVFWAHDGKIDKIGSKEIAFEYVIEPADIVEYWMPSNRYQYDKGESRDAARKFPFETWRRWNGRRGLEPRTSRR